jgi:uncharacterized phiE125 gp8 family phage protein
MTFAVVETVAPTEGPVSLARAKEQLRVAGTDEDALIAAMLAGAVKQAQRECGLQLVTATLTLVLDDFPRRTDGADPAGSLSTLGGVRYVGNVLHLPVGPVQSVASITYRDTAGQTQTLDPATYDVGKYTARVRPINFWPITYPYGLENVSVTYVAGYGNAAAVPADAVSAILLIVADRYQHRGDDTALVHDDRPIPAAACGCSAACPTAASGRGDMPIGDYSVRYVIETKAGQQSTTYGDRKRNYPDAGEAWGRRPEEGGADRQHSAHQVTSRAETVIRLRGRVAVGPDSRLRVKSTGEVYRLEGVRFEYGGSARGAVGETVCECFRVTA